jgi:hypothetical protein
MEEWHTEYILAKVVMANARIEGYNPYAMLLMNRAHYPLRGKNSGLRFRSFLQWNKALAASTRTINEYLECRDKPCELCVKACSNLWTKEHPMLGLDAIHCEFSTVLPLGYQCKVCLMANQGMALEPSKDRLRRDWEEAEAKRKEKLAKFDLGNPATEKVETFRLLRGEGWPDGCIKAKIGSKPPVWQVPHVNAAINFFLQQGRHVGWEEFCLLVEQIKGLDAETPLPEAQEAGTSPVSTAHPNGSANFTAGTL